MVEAFAMDIVEGVPWHRAPRPFWIHRCKPWTIGKIDGQIWMRCACGAIRAPDLGGWQNRNSRSR